MLFFTLQENSFIITVSCFFSDSLSMQLYQKTNKTHTAKNKPSINLWVQMCVQMYLSRQTVSTETAQEALKCVLGKDLNLENSTSRGTLVLFSALRGGKKAFYSNLAEDMFFFTKCTISVSITALHPLSRRRSSDKQTWQKKKTDPWLWMYNKRDHTHTHTL